MRDDLLALEPRDVAWVVAALERLERMAAVHGRVLDPSVGRQAATGGHLARVSARVNARMRGPSDAMTR